jgi:UDPglucose 6-dehydrogenase
MNITIIGTGYVGLVTGACLAEMGNDVVCLDLDHDKVALLNGGGIPIHEPGLAELVSRNHAAARLRFTTDVAAAVAHGDVQMIGVGTPPDEDHAADLRCVLAAARSIGKHMTAHKTVVLKSTVPVGTSALVRAAMQDELSRRADAEAQAQAFSFDMVSNPEFLKEGSAIADFMRPDRVIVGADSDAAVALMRTLYAPFTRNHERLMVMDIASAEFTKYAANAMLATRISFMNELAALADRLGVDIERVRNGIGSDPRIGWSFLYAGTGYGGSCLPKDVRALQKSAEVVGMELRVLGAVEAVNQQQKHVIVNKLVERFGDNLQGRTFAVWGLAFKPNTDDMRDAPSRTVVAELARRGAELVLYDPVASLQAKKVLADVPGLRFVDDRNDAIDGADALLILTDWKEFKSPNFETLRARLKQPLVFDGRNLYEPSVVAGFGIDYVGIGRRAAAVREEVSAAPLVLPVPVPAQARAASTPRLKAVPSLALVPEDATQWLRSG